MTLQFTTYELGEFFFDCQCENLKNKLEFVRLCVYGYGQKEANNEIKYLKFFCEIKENVYQRICQIN